MQHFRSGGNGGQNQNKRDTGTRVIHHPSGARGESREQRSQLQNKRAAFRRMVDTPAFQLWLRIQTGRIDAADAAIRDRLSNLSIPEHELRVEIRVGGRWTLAPAVLHG